MKEVPIWEKSNLTLEEAAAYSGVGINKLRSLSDHTRRPGDVADPWYTGDFEATWQDVLEGCTALLEELR